MNWNEIIAFLKEYSVPLSAVIGLVADVVFAACVMHNSRVVKRALAKAKARGTFTICPHCHKQVKLSDTEFLLPDGSTDNDLDGQPDNIVI